MTDARPVVTFDLFSALLDSRSGAARVLDDLGALRGWQVDGGAVYDDWDRRNKAAQKACDGWRSYRDLAREALRATYDQLGLAGDADPDLERVLDSIPEWPLWPDVEDAVPALAEDFRIGLLSNVDDDLFLRTRAARLVDPDLAMTSQRLGVYKPDARIYRRARERLAPMVHVATSARDVRGALESGIPVVRLQRPGHHLDPEGPRPPLEAPGMEALSALVHQALARR